MSRKEREAIVQNLTETLQGVESMILTHYQGLTVDEMNDLRSRLASARSEYRVVKNTLTKRALEGLGLSEFAKYFEGPSGLVIERGDPVPPAKVLVAFAKEHKHLKLRAAYVSGKILNTQEISELAKIEPRPVLLQKFIMLLNSPLQRLHGTLSAPLGSLVRVLQNLAKKKESKNQ